MEQKAIKLTQYSHGSGCGCKIAPEVLQQILSRSGSDAHFPNLIVGNGEADDAAVWALNEQEYLISTTDFFTPIVDDAFTFGTIAAANALSDVYAMGGQPLMALAILGWPVDKLPAELASEVLRGGKAKCAEAGIPLAGGHSIDSPEPFFGLAVNGLVKKEQLKTNGGAKAGDILLLSKPLGTGIWSTAMKRGAVEEDQMQAVFKQMSQLNQYGAVLGKWPEVHAMTDITGFGLGGHLVEMCRASGLQAQLQWSQVPIINGTSELAAQYFIPDNTYRNFNGYGKEIAEMSADQMMLLCDPQTNGGLLVAMEERKHEAVMNEAAAAGTPLFRIGELLRRASEADPLIIF